MKNLSSWGNIHHTNGEITFLRSSEESIFHNKPTTFFGFGRSYGDLPINNSGGVVCTQDYNEIISADWESGVLKAKSGISLRQILEQSIPHGWFLNVSPGSSYVSLGGAVANDVHGKNHHKAGSFGNFVKSIGLKRSDGSYLELSKDKNQELFNLTISGLGLTGFIDWVEIQLKKISSTNLVTENIRYESLDDFFELSKESNEWEYVAAWVDCLAPEKNIGRGILSRSKHCDDGKLTFEHDMHFLSLPFNFPNWALNRSSIKAFNFMYQSIHSKETKSVIDNYKKSLYPLDSIKNWNRMYGKRGFYQHQCIVPKRFAFDAIEELLSLISRSGQGSFLAVLKNHGPELSPGRNSFCIEGTSLALDFPNNGKDTVNLLCKLDSICNKYGGRIYPAKDANMSSEIYKNCFKNWKELDDAKDPGISSAFWERVTHE